MPSLPISARPAFRNSRTGETLLRVEVRTGGREVDAREARRYPNLSSSNPVT